MCRVFQFQKCCGRIWLLIIIAKMKAHMYFIYAQVWSLFMEGCYYFLSNDNKYLLDDSSYHAIERQSLRNRECHGKWDTKIWNLGIIKALVVPQISGTRSFHVPFQKIGNAFLLRSFFRLGTRVPFCVPFAFLSETFNVTKYWISIGYLKNSSLRLSNNPQ